MKKQMLILPIFLVAVVALILGATASVSWARGFVFNEEFDVECGFEINITDFDAGFYACVDSDGWKALQIYRKGENYRDKQLLFWASTFDGLRRQGLTELCFESREPVGEVEQTLAKFPPGDCKFIAKKFEGGYEYNTNELTHDFACPAEKIVFTSIGDPDVIVDVEEDKCVPADQDLVISWDEVTERLLTVTGEGEYTCGEDEIEIDVYQVFVETADDFDPSQTLSFDPFDDTTMVTVPGAFLKEGTPYKFEVLVIEESGNRSIKEIEFETCPEV